MDFSGIYDKNGFHEKLGCLVGRVACMSAVAVAVLLAGCNPFGKTWESNQKLTVEVATPQGTKSGAAVTQVRWSDVNALGNYSASFEGEATVVEVAPGRYLFALIGEGTTYIAQYTFHRQLGASRGDYQTLIPAIAAFRGSADVPRDAYPLLVTFADIADPRTVRKVDPDDLPASFGPGVALQRVTLEITGEEVSGGAIAAIFPWWKAYRNKQLDGDRYNNTSSRYAFANSLNRLNFGRD